ncbi:MAG: autotransporter family porin, partial [Phycisphaerales bacterium]|nr:autotransporter family porin [Phycisphaerales bacterium]
MQSSLPRVSRSSKYRVLAAAVAAALGASFTAVESRATINFGGRDWNTGGGATTYSGSGNGGSMTGQWAQDAVMTTALTLNVGDTISYDSALSAGGWFSDTGFSFIDNTGLYDSAHSNARGGKVQRFWTSTWEFYAYDPSGAQQAYWYLPNNPGENVHYDWTFDAANHVQVTMKAGANAPVTVGWNITDIADIKAFRAGLWDSQHTVSLSNFKQRPSALPPSGLQRVWSAVSGDYTTGGNWIGGNAPTLADDALIANGGTATISTAGANSGRAINLDVDNGTLNVQSGGELIAANIVRIGKGIGTGTINQNGGLVAIDLNSGADLRIGFDATATGHYNLNAGELWVADSLSVGQNGAGTMTMTGGWISHAGFFTVGNNPGANGTFNMTGGTVDQTFGDFEVGDEAVGVVDISGGTFNVAKDFWFSIGNRAAGTGYATISGSAVVTANSMIVGRNATSLSHLDVDGGVIKLENDFFVGLEGPGQMAMTGGDLQIEDDFVIGHKTSGSVSMSGGVVSKSGWIVIGDEPSGSGTLDISGGTINQTFGDLEIGDAGAGTFNQSGGAVNISDTVYVAKQAGSSGDANVSGGVLNAQAVINNGTFDASGTASVNVGPISGSGVMTVAGAAQVNAQHVRQSSLNMSGGTIKIAQTTTGTAAGVSIVPSYTLTGAARFDLGDNKLLTNNPAGTATAGVYSGVQGDVQRASNGGAWDSPGLTTSMPDAASGLTSIGVATGEQLRGLGPTDTDLFAGQTITGSTTIAMYTYAGDANLDGFISGDDYSTIDFNVGTSADGWVNGDFNYDGIIS